MISPVSLSQTSNVTNFSGKFFDKIHPKTSQGINAHGTSLPSLSTNSYFGINGERNAFKDSLNRMTYSELNSLEKKYESSDEFRDDENASLKLYDVRIAIDNRKRMQKMFGELVVNPFYPSLTELFGEDALRGYSCAAKLRSEKYDDLSQLSEADKALIKFFEVKDAISDMSNSQLYELLDIATVKQEQYVADAKAGMDLINYPCFATYQIEAIKSELKDRNLFSGFDD